MEHSRNIKEFKLYVKFETNFAAINWNQILFFSLYVFIFEEFNLASWRDRFLFQIEILLDRLFYWWCEIRIRILFVCSIFIGFLSVIGCGLYGTRLSILLTTSYHISLNIYVILITKYKLFTSLDVRYFTNTLNHTYFWFTQILKNIL